MSSRRTMLVCGPATVGCLILLCAAFACLYAGPAGASYYRMVLCGANNGSNTYSTIQSPSDTFTIENKCGPAPYPAGNNAYVRVFENQAGITPHNSYAQVAWTAPASVQIGAAGGYTRMPGEFNDGWRGRFFVEGYDGSANNILMQGSGVANGSCGGVCWATTSSFGSHLWPFDGYGHYRRFLYELTCVRVAGCDRAGWNVVDANSFQLVLDDVSAPVTDFTGSHPLQDGQWVRGDQSVSWESGDEGSGIRFERLRINGEERALVDRRSACNIDTNPATGEFARDFQPCPGGGPFGSQANVNTATLSDGTHSMTVCVQDYGQSQGLSGSGGETCDQRTIKTDNSPPAAPGGLAIESENPSRYLDHFGARWTLPPDPGSPITKAHYDIVDSAGLTVVPEKTVASTNPTKLGNIVAPKSPGAYRLRVWLEDSVGFSGPVSTVPIPRDTTPPAAPQDVAVTLPGTSRSADGFDVRWRNITDSGAPIDAVHYEVSNGAGQVVVATQDIGGDNPQTIQNLATPRDGGSYTLKLWLSDAEGNKGAASTAPLSYRCTRSEEGGGNSISAGLGTGSNRVATVNQGTGSALSGSVRGAGGAIRGATVCVFSKVITDARRDFVGIAMTGQGGSFNFPIAAEASREITAVYRGDHREVEDTATILTRVRPTFKVRKRVVRNKRAAVFSGAIPGPHNDKVVVVLQVKSGKGWRAFRRYRTRSNGRYSVRYRFTRTRTPTLYIMRAQVRETTGYPYLQGNSRSLKLKVMP